MKGIFVLIVCLVLGCSPNLSPLRQVPSEIWALDQEAPLLEVPQNVQEEPGEALLLVAESDNLGRYVRKIDRKDLNLDWKTLAAEPKWMRVSRGVLPAKKMGMLERKAGHGDGMVLLDKFRPCTLHTSLYLKKEGSWDKEVWEQTGSKSLLVVNSQFSKVHYPEVNIRCAYHASGGRIVVEVQNLSTEAIPLYEPGSLMRFHFEGQGLGKNGIHRFSPSEEFLKRHLRTNTLAQSDSLTTLLDIPASVLFGPQPEGIWSFRGTAAYPGEKWGKIPVSEIRFWFALTIKGKRRVSAIMRHRL